MTRWTSYNKTVPLCFLPGENIQLTIAFWRPGYCLVKPKLTRVQPWFNQTGFYGCETRVTRLYEWVKSLVNQAISGKLSKPGIILKKTKQWLYRGSWSFESTGLTRPLTLSVVQVGFCVPWLIVRKQLWSTILEMRFGGSVRVWLSISFLPRSPQPKARNSYLF